MISIIASSSACSVAAAVHSLAVCTTRPADFADTNNAAPLAAHRAELSFVICYMRGTKGILHSIGHMIACGASDMVLGLNEIA